MKKLLVSLGVSVLVGLSGCASKNLPSKTLDNVILETQKPKQPEYKTTFSDSNFEVRRNNGDYFQCNHNECLLHLDDSGIELTNDRFRDKTAPIVDYIRIPGFNMPGRYSIFTIEDPEFKKYALEKYQKADQIYRNETTNFKVDEAYTKWLARPDPLDDYLNKNSK